MTAREALTNTLENALAQTCVGRVGRAKELAAKLVDKALKEHAHELAEASRKFAGPRAYPWESDRVARYVAGWHDAADHIDPEVTT